jgi:signal peptidase II
VKARRNKVLAGLLLLVTIGCDRVTKHIATDQLSDGSGHSFLYDTLRLQYAENTGAFLSLGANLPTQVRTALLTVGVAVLLIVVAALAIMRRWKGMSLAGVALMWAGGVSNLIDRATQGHVVDFINVGIGPLRTGIFNIADVAVMMGAILIVFGNGSPAAKQPDAA